MFGSVLASFAIVFVAELGARLGSVTLLALFGVALLAGGVAG